MSGWGATLVLFALAAILSTAVGAVAAAAALAVVRRRLEACDGRRRHRALVAISALPSLVAVTLMLSVTLPALVAVIAPASDHCNAHDDHHAHLCFRHVPHGISPLLTAVLLGLAVIVGVQAIRVGLRFAQTRRLLGNLVASGETDAAHGITVVEGDLPVCLVAGILRPRVVVARALLDRLDTDQREIVLAHERAHVARRDAMVGAAVRILACFHLPPVAAWLVRELDVAAEQACDEVAAEHVGDRIAVAAMILAMHRAWLARGCGGFGALAPGFALRASERRIQALLTDPGGAPSFAVHAWCLAALLALALCAAGSLHHWTESLLSHVAS